MQGKKKVAIIDTSNDSFKCLLCNEEIINRSHLWSTAVIHFKDKHSKEGINGLVFVPENTNKGNK
jgi:hypothetical protein